MAAPGEGTDVSGEVLRAAVVAVLAAHGDELVVDAGLLEGQQRARHERRDRPSVHLGRRHRLLSCSASFLIGSGTVRPNAARSINDVG